TPVPVAAVRSISIATVNKLKIEQKAAPARLKDLPSRGSFYFYGISKTYEVFAKVTDFCKDLS
ncbi:MAG TPA: hypothetical protein P5082_09860, partial [Treponema sp.]|nr:hypothetical protein [Treponema sp.]